MFRKSNNDHAVPKQKVLHLHFDVISQTRKIVHMKKTHIILLIGVAAVIAGLLTMMKDLSTYDTIASAKKKEGRFVHLITKLDRSEPVIYDPIKDPNFLSFHAVDSIGGRTRVVYRNAKPTDFERSVRIVMKGRMNGEVFECNEIVLKCPSKYKDGPDGQMKALDTVATRPEAAVVPNAAP